MFHKCAFTLALLFSASCFARRLGEHHHMARHEAHQTAIGQHGGKPRENVHEKRKRKEHHKAPTPNDAEKIESSHEMAPEYSNSTDCGTFVVRQHDSIVIYDDFKEAHNFDIDNMMCVEGQKDGHENCFGGDGNTPLVVQGRCTRGVGTTQVGFTGTEEDADLLFACEASPRAVPSVKCLCSSDNYKAPCDIPFHAVARFGFLKIPTFVGVQCTLICKMPTTNN